MAINQLVHRDNTAYAASTSRLLDTPGDGRPGAAHRRPTRHHHHQHLRSGRPSRRHLLPRPTLGRRPGETTIPPLLLTPARQAPTRQPTPEAGLLCESVTQHRSPPLLPCRPPRRPNDFLPALGASVQRWVDPGRAVPAGRPSSVATIGGAHDRREAKQTVVPADMHRLIHPRVQGVAAAIITGRTGPDWAANADTSKAAGRSVPAPSVGRLSGWRCDVPGARAHCGRIVPDF